MDYIAAVVDHSGSMNSIRGDAEGGLNEFLLTQQKQGKARLTLAEFDDHYTLIHDDIKLKDFKSYKLEPRGMTALLDAIGKTATSVKDVRVRGKKFLVIVTDGLENRSKEWNSAGVLALITEMREKKWEIIFIGADEASLAQARSIGIDSGTTFIFDKSAQGAKDSYDVLTSYTNNLRGGMSKTAALASMDDTIYRSKTMKKSEV